MNLIFASNLLLILTCLSSLILLAKCDESDLAVHTSIVNPHNFTYLLNPAENICGKIETHPNVFLLVYVHTSPDNFKRRLSIRETWSKRSMFRDLRIVFMMGKSEMKKTNELLKLEYNLYGDLVQEDFADSYRNLTYKGIMAMKWMAQYCPQAKFILKVDDDIIINIFNLLRHLKSLDKHVKPKKAIMCNVFNNMPVQREKKSKWYLSKDEFKKDYFGKYCSGSAYLLTGDLPLLLYNISWYIKFFWIDDYYISGLLIRGVNASYIPINSLYTINSEIVEQKFTGNKKDFTLVGHFGSRRFAINKMYHLWRFILRTQMRFYSSLSKRNGESLIYQNDFANLDFFWAGEIWLPFYTKLKSLNEEKIDWNYDY